jgi:hypothetical protein
VIDGKELSDSDWIIGNGPEPVGAYGTLATGSTFDFGKALLIAKYQYNRSRHSHAARAFAADNRHAVTSRRTCS